MENVREKGRAYRDDTLQTSVQLVDVVEDLLHCLFLRALVQSFVRIVIGLYVGRGKLLGEGGTVEGQMRAYYGNVSYERFALLMKG